MALDIRVRLLLEDLTCRCRKRTNAGSQSSGNSLKSTRNERETDTADFYAGELGFFIFENGGGDTRFVRPLADHLSNLIKQGVQVLVSPVTQLLAPPVLLVIRPVPKNWDVVLVILACASEERDSRANIQDLPQHAIVNIIHANTIAQRKSGVQSISLDIRPNGDLHTAILRVSSHIPNNAVRFQVEHVEVLLDFCPSQRLASCLALIFATLIPRAASDCEALCAADDAVEGVEGGTIDAGGLMSD